MASPQLLISHSTEKDPPRRKIVDDLAKKLGKKFAVLLDRTTIVPGESWRNTLNVWTGTCDAAVVLVTPQSIASEFCRYEWSILGFRRSLDPKFPVIPLYLGATPKDIKDAPHQLASIQGKPFTTVPAACTLIGKSLAKLTRRTGKTPGEQQAQYIAAILRMHANSPYHLKRAADRLKLDLGKWDPTRDDRLLLALKLMGAGVDPASRAIEEVAPLFRGHRGAFYDLLELVACSWVDLSLATTIATCASGKPAAQRGVALNAEQPGTAKFCVLRASDKSPSDMWPAALLPNVFETLEQLTTQIYSSLASEFRLPGQPPDRAAIADRLRVFEKRNSPVFVVLRDDGLTRDWLAALRKEFSTVTFFLLTAKRAISDTSYPHVTILTPPLHDGFESRFWEDYQDAKTYFDSKRELFEA